MTRRRAITVYVILPCLLYAALFVAVLTRFSGTVDPRELTWLHAVFGAVMTLLLRSKQDQLSGDQ